jgi:hypothetical protein
MNSRQRLEAIFAGHMVDRIPFSLKGWRVPQCQAELELRNRGLAIFDSYPVYSVHSPNVESQTHTYTERGAVHTRTRLRTPAGELTTVSRGGGSGARTESTSWRVELMFKGPDDYRAIEAMYEDRRYVPAYEGFLSAQQQVGEEAYFKTGAPGSPLHDIIYGIMGIDAFAVEWAERRDAVLHLHEVIERTQRPIWEIVARGPARVVQCGGNYSPQVLGLQRFLDFVVPHWQQAGAVLHDGGKLLGSHLDADNALWAAQIAASPLDWIEAFTPAPDTDMTLAQARRAWPGTVLYINFPSSVHLASRDVIAQTTRDLVRQSAPGDRLIIGITENVPENRWRESFRAIMDTLDECGRLPVAGG